MQVSAGKVESPAIPTAANELITKKYFDENSDSNESNTNVLPTVSESDNGKFLCVVNGAWAASKIENVEEVYY